MDPQIVSLIIQLISGAAGGNLAGAILKNINLGTLMNSVSGAAGGWLLPFVLKMLGIGGAAAAAAGGADAAGMDIGAILRDVGGGGVGGGLLMAILGMVKKMLSAPK